MTPVKLMPCVPIGVIKDLAGQDGTVVVKKNFTFLKTPFPLHGVKTVVLGTYRCRTVLENYRNYHIYVSAK